MVENPPGKPDTQYEVDRNLVESANWGEHAAPAVTRGATKSTNNQHLQQRERVSLNDRNQVLGTKCLRQKCDFLGVWSATRFCLSVQDLAEESM